MNDKDNRLNVDPHNCPHKCGVEVFGDLRCLICGKTMEDNRLKLVASECYWRLKDNKYYGISGLQDMLDDVRTLLLQVFEDKDLRDE